MLKPLAEAYSIRVEPIRRYYPAMTDSVSDPEEEPCRQLPACEIQVYCGTLQITNDPPADLQLRKEEFNDLLNQADKEIMRIQKTEIEHVPQNSNQSMHIMRLQLEIDQLGEGRDPLHKAAIVETPDPGVVEAMEYSQSQQKNHSNEQR